MGRKGTGFFIVGVGCCLPAAVATGSEAGPPAPYLPVACRAADGLGSCPIPPKQTRPENGEHGPSALGQSSAFQLGTDPGGSPLPVGNRPSGGKEAPRALGPVPPPEEGAERTKHSKTRLGGSGQRGGAGQRLASRWLFDQTSGPRFLSPESGRKQKTPKKFTGEQPSISGTFGLKGEVLAGGALVGRGS